MHHTKARSIGIFIISFLIGGSILGYAYYQSRNFIQGPQITLTSPLNGETLRDPLVSIEGSASHIARIELNGNQIFINDKNHFEEKLLLLEGYNIITLHAVDKFKRSITHTVEVTLVEDSSTEETPLLII